MTDFNIREDNHIHESILFWFSRGSDDTIVIINYCILYAKPYYIYLEKPKDENKNVDVT